MGYAKMTGMLEAVSQWNVAESNEVIGLPGG
jgi:hypothetical protein